VTRPGEETYRVDDGVSVADATAELEADVRVDINSEYSTRINRKTQDFDYNINGLNNEAQNNSLDTEINYGESAPSDDGDNSDDSDSSGPISGIVDTVTDPFEGSDSGSSDSDDGGNTGDSNDGDDAGGSGVFTNPLF